MDYIVDVVQKVITFSVGSPVVAIIVQAFKKMFDMKGIAVRWIALIIGVIGGVLLAVTTTIPDGMTEVYHWLTHLGAGLVAGLTSWKIYEMAKDAGRSE